MNGPDQCYHKETVEYLVQDYCNYSEKFSTLKLAREAAKKCSMPRILRIRTVTIEIQTRVSGW